MNGVRVTWLINFKEVYIQLGAGSHCDNMPRHVLKTDFPKQTYPVKYSL